jgi:membrane-associated phospholipid phosphatase
MSVAPRAGSAFLLVAIGILAGAVSGRYHYAVDAVAGAAVGIAAFAIALRI